MHDPDLIFSLGPNCRNAWNLRDYFGVERAYPFDWWITPAKSMLALLAPGTVFSASRDDLVVTEPEGGSNTVYNRRLNILHHHDFDRKDGLITPLTDAAIEGLNSKCQALFARLLADVGKAERPLVIMNGIFGGWAGRMPDGSRGHPLNGRPRPQELVDGIRERLGSKVQVLLVSAGEARREILEGGEMISLPDSGIRQADLPRGKGFAEPVQVFRDAYAAVGLVRRAAVVPTG